MSRFFDKVKDYFLKVKNMFIKPDKIHATPVESVDDVTPRLSPQRVVEEGATFVITEGSPPAESPESIEPIALIKSVEPVAVLAPVVSIIEILEHDGVVHALEITTETVDSPVDSSVSSLD